MASGPRATPPRTLLIEDLGALGADVTDTEQKAAWLEAAGARVSWLAIADPDRIDSGVDENGRHGRIAPWAGRAEAIRARLSEARWHRVVLASAATGGGALAPLLPRDALWWPTGIAGSSGPSLGRTVRRLLGRSPGLRPLAGGDADVPAALAWAAIEERGIRRAGLPLWDGDLLLLPEGVQGPTARAIVAAFAHLADQWSGVDLVTWSHPTVAGDEHARALGLDTRIHAVGPPRRSAEWSWWSQAEGAVLTGASRASSGLVLRALASGCPLLWVAPVGPASELARWMVERGVASCVAADPAAIAAALARMLERSPEIEVRVRAGRALASRLDPAELIARLGAPLGLEPRRRPAAA
jgi:hypothetical protein